jgi:hypothetical protein
MDTREKQEEGGIERIRAMGPKERPSLVSLYGRKRMVEIILEGF